MPDTIHIACVVELPSARAFLRWWQNRIRRWVSLSKLVGNYVRCRLHIVSFSNGNGWMGREYRNEMEMPKCGGWETSNGFSYRILVAASGVFCMLLWTYNNPIISLSHSSFPFCSLLRGFQIKWFLRASFFFHHHYKCRAYHMWVDEEHNASYIHNMDGL